VSRSTTLPPLLARATAELERGRGAEAARLLAPVLASPSLTRDEELAIRIALTEAWLLQDDVEQAAAALGRAPDSIRETVSAARLSTLWRLHGRLAAARGEPSRAIALQGRSLKHAELAHESRAIGLAHYELAHCYRKVGDVAIVREHITKAASALQAAGDRRHLALIHSLSGIVHAQLGRYEEAMTALRHAERLASLVQADDVVATACGNQANVLMLQHRYEQARALAERSVSIHEAHGSGHGLAVALATLGQISVRLGDMNRAEAELHRALEVRSPIQFHETTGAVFDTLAQIHLVRGRYDEAREYLERASDAYGAYGSETSHWYEWSVRVLNARLALKRGALDEAVGLATQILQAGAPPLDSLQAMLIAAEALTAAGRVEEADDRLRAAADALDPRVAPQTWGEFLRLRGTLRLQQHADVEAYHDFAQSATVLDLLGEQYQAALSRLAIGRLLGSGGATQAAVPYLDEALAVFVRLGAERDAREAEALRSTPTSGTGGGIARLQQDADSAIVARIVGAAALPELLERETAAALTEATGGRPSVVFVELPADAVRVIARASCDGDTALALARSCLSEPGRCRERFCQALGRAGDGPRYCAVGGDEPLGEPQARRLEMIALVARQGLDLCAARDRSVVDPGAPLEGSLEPLLPGFLCASAAMSRVVEQIQRLQTNDLTVLITGESGTGKELVARAIHSGSHRSDATFLPYNCTTTGRDLADSQLFGHRRGAFTGAVSDQPGLVRTANGGTLFLDEIGDLPLDVQPKLLRFLEQSEIMPIGETRPQRVDVRVLAATNADLEQRVAEGRFREDLYYRLSVIRIHVPPLRDRREEIPHLSTYFLHEAAERLGKPDVTLSPEVLDVFAQYWWPGNVRQLRNEIQRAVALSPAGGTVQPVHLSPEVGSTRLSTASSPGKRGLAMPTSLATAVEQLEREVIQAALDRSGGNIAESARTLGLTRRGLYLKLRRLGLGADAGVGPA